MESNRHLREPPADCNRGGAGRCAGVNPLNPEAGDTPAPTDPRELAIARRAAALVWRAAPYLAFRYGERGRAFALSDAAWLVTLAALPRDARLAQVEWLAGLLSPRGMPSCLLEIQLRAIARVGARGEWSGAEALADGARHLETRRHSVLSEESFQLAGQLFSEIVGPSRLANGTGKMVASAEVDVALGFSPSSASFTAWFGATHMVAPRWLDAIERVRLRFWITGERAAQGDLRFAGHGERRLQGMCASRPGARGALRR